MEENRKHIDDLFKKELGSYTEVPPDDVWASLDKRLDDTPQPKVAGKPNTWVWYLVAALVIGTILFFVFNNLSSDKDKEKEDEKTEQAEHSSSSLSGPTGNSTLAESGNTEENSSATESKLPAEISKDATTSGSNLTGQLVDGTEAKGKDGGELSTGHAHASTDNTNITNNSGSSNKANNQSSQTGRRQNNKSADDNTGNGDGQAGTSNSNNKSGLTANAGTSNDRKRTGNHTKTSANQSVGNDKVADEKGDNGAAANANKSTGSKKRNNSKRGIDNSNATDAKAGNNKATNATGDNSTTANANKSTGSKQQGKTKKGTDNATSTDAGLGSDKATNAAGDNSTTTANANKSRGSKQQGNTKTGTGNDNATNDAGLGSNKAASATKGNTANNTGKSTNNNKKGSGNKDTNNPNAESIGANDKVANSATKNAATNAGKSADKKKAGNNKKSAEYSSANDVAKTNSESATQKNNSTDPQSGSANKNAGTKSPSEPKVEPTLPTANKGNKQDESPAAIATTEKPQEPALKEAADTKKDIQYEKGFTAANREEGGIKVNDYLNSSSGNAAGGDKQTANEEQGKTAGKGGGGGASEEQEKEKKKRTNKFDFGVKAGFETGFNSYKANKIVVSPYIQYALARNISVLLQPTVKYATINKTELDGQASYFRQGISTLDSAHTIIPNPDTLLPDQIIRRYYYQGKYDSISVINSIAEKKYWEVELPLLLQYKLSKQLSIFFGGAVNISKVVQVKDEFKEYAMTLRDSVIYPIAPQPEPGPPVTPANQKFVYTGTPFSQYSNSSSNSSTNPMRVSLLFGINYHVTERLFFDVMIQQTVSNTKYIPNNSVRDIYKQSNVRFGIGYRFSK